MSRIDSETKRKLREMGVATLVDALEARAQMGSLPPRVKSLQEWSARQSS